MLTFAVAILVTGCMKNEEYCVESEMPATLHPVIACDNCSWQEL